jgi:opacity protein-like surface antigen
MTRVLAALVPAAAVVFAASSASAQDLQPPPPMSSTPTTYYAAAPKSDESQSSGLGLEWFYLNAGGGFAYTDMGSLSTSGSLGITKTSSAGGSFDVGLGARLLFFSVGVRARDLLLSSYSLWELDAEVAFHIRIWRIDPYFGFRGGYAFVGNLASGAKSVTSGTTSPDITVHGANVGPMFGIDVYVTNYLTIGAEANGEFLFLHRPPVAKPAGVTDADVMMLPPSAQELYNESGSSVGFGVVGTVHLGLHY